MKPQELLAAKYGNPLLERKTFEAMNLVYWDIPLYYNTMIPALPNHLYCHKDFIEPFSNVLKSLCESGYYREIKTFDGCYNVRLIRGSKSVLSIHSWALAIDLNAAHNPLGLSKQDCIAKGLKPFTPEFDNIFRQHNFTCGVDFTRADGMHFEYVKPLINRK